MTVYVSTLPGEKDFGIDLKVFKEFAEDLLKALCREDLELSLVFTDDEHIRQLNRDWRKKDKPTDVLSFPQDFPERVFSEKSPLEELKEVLKVCKDCHLLGDIVISVDTAKRQAEEYGVPLEEEIKRLIVHGLVHLLGFDHERSKTDEDKFRRLEKLLMDAVSRGETLLPCKEKEK